MQNRRPRFQRGDRMAIAALTLLLAGGVLTTFLLRPSAGVSDVSDVSGGKGRRAVERVAPDTAVASAARRPFDDGTRRHALFEFDPNTADSTQLLRLGLQEWQVRSIYKYRNAGGVFRKPADFARLYGLTVEQYRRLEPYIRIRGDFRPAAVLVGEAESRQDSLYPTKLREGETIDLATADSAALRRVPGIGAGFARRILAYGDRLGGYVSVGQLAEIDGFPTDAIRFFELGSRVAVRRVNVNGDNLRRMMAHPYMGFYRARAIDDFRRHHGRLTSIEQLRGMEEFPDDVIERLEPYLEF